jgi:photosystem II stability/assembly factor-like uncharacterized protein
MACRWLGASSALLIALAIAGAACAESYEEWLYARLAPKGLPPLAVGPAAVPGSAPLAAPDGPAWTDAGPTSVANGQLLNGSGPVSGHVLSIALHPTNTAIAYIGTRNGGVWKTTDSGASWMPLTDDQPSLAIGALAVDPVNPNVVYAGTGDPRVNSTCFNYYGAGLLKSTDGGATWTQLGVSQFRFRGISSIAIDPSNTSILYVATGTANLASATLACDSIPGVPTRGVYKSTDGGATFTLILATGSSIDRIAIDPTSPQTLYVGAGNVGILKSTNGGGSFVLLAGGLPAGPLSRTNVAVDPASPGALVVAIDDDAAGGRVFRSTDGGTTFTELAAAAGFCNEAAPLGTSQCAFNLVVATGPLGPILLGGFTKLLRSTDAGVTFGRVENSGQSLHASVLSIVFHPANPNIVWVGTSGGVWRSDDGGASYSNRNTNQSTLPFMSVAGHPTNPDVVVGGIHQNGTVSRQSGRTWTNIRTGNGGKILIDPRTPTRYVHVLSDTNLERSENAGSNWTCKLAEPASGSCPDLMERASFYLPLAMDPNISSTLYIGTFRVHRSFDAGDTFTPISPDLSLTSTDYVTAIAPSPSNTLRIYAATRDGLVWVTSDGGTNWTLRSTGLPIIAVTGIAVDPTDSAIAYVTITSFGSGHVFKTTDAGLSWTNVTSNMPDFPALSIQAVDRDTLIVGTDIGVMVTHDGGASWNHARTGFPRVATFDLAINRTTNRVLAATHGRGVFTNQLMPTASFTQPVTGTRVTPGTTLDVRFAALEGIARPFFASLDVDLSTDGGATFTVPVASGLPPATTGLVFAVPRELRTLRARLRLQAKDPQGVVVATALTDPFLINTPPVARIQAPANVLPNTEVTLNGAGSSDADGDALSFAWTQTGGEPVQFDTRAPAPTFTAPDTERNELDFALQVSDGLETAQASARVLTAVTVLSAGQRTPGCSTRGPARTADPFWVVMLLGACAALVRRGRAATVAVLMFFASNAIAEPLDRTLSQVIEHPELTYQFGVGSYRPKSSRAHGQVHFLTALRLIVPDRKSDENELDGIEFTVGYLPTLFEDMVTFQLGALKFLERTDRLPFDHHFFYGGGAGSANINRRIPDTTVVAPQVFLTGGLQVRAGAFSVETSARYVFGFRKHDYDTSGLMAQVMGSYFFEL